MRTRNEKDLYQERGPRSDLSQKVPKLDLGSEKTIDWPQSFATHSRLEWKSRESAL